MSILEDLMAAELAQVVATPGTVTDELGTDLRWVDDLDETAASVSGVELLVQDLFHLLDTAPGQLVDDPTWGYGIKQRLLSVGLTPARIAQIPAEIAAALRKDDRVTTVDVVMSQPAPGETLIRIAGESDAGPFRFTVVADQAGDLVLEVE